MPVPLRRLRTLPLLLVAVLGWLIPSAHADPGPDNPSEEDISAAYTAVESTAARVGRLEAELARAHGERCSDGSRRTPTVPAARLLPQR